MYRTFLAGSPWEKIVSFFLKSATFLDTPAVSRKDCASKTGAFTFGSFLTIEKAWLNLDPIVPPERNRCLWGKRPTDRHTFRRLVLTRLVFGQARFQIDSRYCSMAVCAFLSADSARLRTARPFSAVPRLRPTIVAVRSRASPRSRSANFGATGSSFPRFNSALVQAGKIEKCT